MRNGRSDQWSVVSGQKDHSRRTAHLLTTDHRPLTTGFTITELLIVIGIIVLAMALAVPALNLITGNKSTEAATNQLSALLARARDDAIGLQKMHGIMFYYDQSEDRVNVALVEETDPPTPAMDASNTNDLAVDKTMAVDVYLDLTDSADHLALPKGVFVQTVDSCVVTTTVPPVRQDDGYIGFNTKNANPNGIGQCDTQYGGVILFDGHGQVVSKSYAFLTHKDDLTSNTTPPAQIFTAMGGLLFSNQAAFKNGPCDPNTYKDVVPVNPGLVTAAPVPNPQLILRSQVGFVLFDLEVFRNQGYGFPDDQITTPGTYSAAELAEENWLDANAVPYLVNRYNGTLVKGE